MVTDYKMEKSETARSSWFDMYTNQHNKYNESITGPEIFVNNSKYFS